MLREPANPTSAVTHVFCVAEVLRKLIEIEAVDLPADCEIIRCGVTVDGKLEIMVSPGYRIPAGGFVPRLCHKLTAKPDTPPASGWGYPVHEIDTATGELKLVERFDKHVGNSVPGETDLDDFFSKAAPDIASMHNAIHQKTLKIVKEDDHESA